MTVQPNLLSSAITSLNATPPVRATAGGPGGAGWLRTIFGKCAALTTGNTAGGILRMCRMPSNCYIVEIYWKVDATVTVCDCDVEAYYSNAYDGTTPTNIAAADTAIDADFFASAVDMKTQSTLGWTPITFESTTYTAAKLAQPLWQALGLTSDPGGFIDICFTNTSTTNGAPVLSCRVDFTMPA